MNQEIIARYHDLCDAETASESQALLDELQPRRQLTFGGRRLCTVLRPHFLTPAQYETIKRQVGILAGAFDRVYQALMADDAMRAELDLSPAEEEVVHYDFGYATPTPMSRLDSFLSPDGTLHFVEYNAESPAGAGYEDVLGEIFLELPLMRRFLEEYAVVKHPRFRPHILQTLLALYREAGGAEHPTICIIDWPDVPTRTEFEIFRAHFEEAGYPTVVADPRELEYDGEALTVAGRKVHILYKRVLTSELLTTVPLDSPVMRAIRDRAVVIGNPFSCKLLHKKMLFAILTDERYQHLYTPKQQAAIGRHIPWTRKVEVRRTRIDGEDVDLLPYLSDNKDDFVIKPNDEYGGKGVLVGWEMSQAAWDTALENALTYSAVAQHKVKIAHEPFPVIVDGELVFAERLVDLDPYLFMGRDVHGCLTRLAASTLLNVTAGSGSIVPTYVVRPK